MTLEAVAVNSSAKEYTGRAFHSSETEGCEKACGISAENERIVDLARLDMATHVILMCVRVRAE